MDQLLTGPRACPTRLWLGVSLIVCLAWMAICFFFGLCLAPLLSKGRRGSTKFSHEV